jgi:hypothetical protein
MDATSQNSSQWNKNCKWFKFIELSRSDFDPGRRIISNGNATIKWSKFTKSRIGFYEGASRNP